VCCSGYIDFWKAGCGIIQFWIICVLGRDIQAKRRYKDYLNCTKDCSITSTSSTYYLMFADSIRFICITIIVP
jgi:hypothetical protein